MLLQGQTLMERINNEYLFFISSINYPSLVLTGEAFFIFISVVHLSEAGSCLLIGIISFYIQDVEKIYL